MIAMHAPSTWPTPIVPAALMPSDKAYVIPSTGRISADPLDVGRLLGLGFYVVDGDAAPFDAHSNVQFTGLASGDLVQFDGENFVNVPNVTAASLFTQTAAKTVANTASETDLSDGGTGTLLLLANFFSVGRSLRADYALERPMGCRSPGQHYHPYQPLASRELKRCQRSR